MIEILINEPKFEYDIHSLVKAFYPGEDVVVSLETGTPFFTVCFSDSEIAFTEAEGAFDNRVELEGNIDKAEEKNRLKRLIYSSLSNYLGRKLPWGDLTGIRPTKIPMKLLEEGKDDDEILAYMKDTYYISDEKGRLSIEIARRERDIINAVDCRDGYSLYIGIPFCPTTCLYCSFTSNPIAMWAGKVEDYLNCLDRELEYTVKSQCGRNPDTIYIGGGTPTTLTAAELEKLLGIIDKYFDVNKLAEFTVEAGRADSINSDKLNVLHKHRVTRISVNPQTMNQKTLDVIGRRHTVEDVKRAYYEAREAGFDNINMDIILGLPGEGPCEVEHTISEIEKLAPDSLTVHSLAIKRGSRLNERIEAYGLSAMINTPETMKIAEDGARRMGLLPYYLYRQKNMAGNFENTGYARAGAYGIYNILIMEEVQTIVACGAGTVTKRVYPDGRIERCDNVKDVNLYISKIEEMIDRKRQLFAD